MTATRTPKTDTRILFWVLLISLLWGLSFGLNYGSGNQNTYLLHGLKIHAGDILKQDWLAEVASDYHPVFTRLAVLLYALDDSGWIFGLANVLLIALGGVTIFGIIATLAEKRHALLIFALVAGFGAITRTESVSDSYIFSTVLQPSTFGAVGFLGGLFFFFRGSYFLSGLALAAGGLIHANYLVLSFPVFGLAHLGLSRRIVFADLCKQFALPLLAMIPLLMLMLGAAMAESSVQAQEILFKIRSPHHYDPSSFFQGFLSVLGWLTLSLAARWWTGDSSRTERATRSMVWSLLGLTLVATLLTGPIWVPFVAQLYIWRVTPLAILLVQILTARFFVQNVMTRVEKPSFHALVSALFGMGMLGIYHYLENYEYRITALFLILACGAGVILLRHLGRRLEKSLLLAMGLAAVLLGPGWDTARLNQYSNLIHDLPEAETALYEWVSTTDKNTLFVVPVGMDRFRFHARRAIVVDWKSTPIVASEILEWYRRIEILCGTPGVQSKIEAVRGYAAMSRERLEEIRAEFGADFVVLATPHENGLSRWFPISYQNERYVVLKLS